MIRKTLSVSLLAFCSVASASSWIKLYQDKGLTITLDLASIQRRGRYLSVWTKNQYVTPKVYPSFPQPVDHDLYRFILDCGQRQIGMAEVASMDSNDGQIMRHADPGFPPPMAIVLPDSNGEKVLQETCWYVDLMKKFEVPAKKK